MRWISTRFKKSCCGRGYAFAEIILSDHHIVMIPTLLNVGLHQIFQTASLCGDGKRHLHSIDLRGRIPFVDIDNRVHGWQVVH
jgi:hypothetical protein